MVCGANQSLESEIQQIVEIRADEPVQDSQPLYERVEDYKPYKDDMEHTVTNILKRPYLVSNFQWTPQGGNSLSLAKFFPMYELQKIDNFKAKLAGFKYIKHGIKIRVMCNFTPFQTGKLLVAAIPTPPGCEFQDGGEYSLYQLSTFRHIEVDAGSQEEIEMELPFFSDVSCYDTVDEGSQWEIVVKVLNQLGGSTNNEVVDVNIYAMLTDVDVALPTGQSATEGDKKVQKGVISSTLDTVSHVAGSLAKVPILSSIAGPVSWAAGAAAGIAQYFGYSKPFNEAVTQRVTIQPGSGLANADGMDNSLKLSVMTNNQVEQLDTPDEMGIAQIIKRQGLIGQGTWEFANNPYDTLYSVRVTPRMYNRYLCRPKDEESKIKHLEIAQQPPLSFIADMFTYWHGDISYRVSFAKNSFYSGKLMVVFRPNATTESNQHDDQVYRRIISVKNSNDFIVTIPYIYHKHWANIDEDIGMLEFVVFNRLQATPSVPSQIQFNVFAFSNNMRFAYPATSLFPTFFMPDPITEIVRFPTSHLASKREAMAVAQSIQSSSVDQTAESDYLFHVKGTEEPEKYTTGEVITNLRLLTRRQNLFSNDAIIKVSSASYNKDYNFDITKYDALPLRAEAILSYLGGMYLFKRGSMRFKGFTGKNTGLGFVQQTNNEALATGDLYIDPYRISGATALTLNTVNGALEAEIPFYSDRARWYTSFDQINHKMPAFIMGFMNDSNISDEDPKIWFGAGGDDFTFSFYQGIPGVVIRQV